MPPQIPIYAPGANRAPAGAADVARLFQMLRRHLGMTPEQAAALFHTRWDVIAALESGSLGRLPPWPETQRVILEYTKLCRIDPRPVLHLMQDAIAARSRTVDVEAEEQPSRFKRRISGMGQSTRQFFQALKFATGFSLPSLRLLFAFTLPVATLILFTQTAVIEAAANKLPTPMARMIKGAREYVMAQMAPIRDGLRWIDVSDPRDRRGDKLRNKQR